MPLTKKGKQALRNFKKRYGEERGEEIFYRYMNKYPEKTNSWEVRKN